MPKRSREDSPPPSPSTSLSPTPEPSSPASADTPSHSAKYIQIFDEAPAKAVMKCSLPPHKETLAFSTFEEFEVHYAQVHAYRCSECRKNFPTEYFLELHINENHDPLSEARRAKGEKTNYDFLIVNTGIDKRSSMLRTGHRRRSSAASRALHREQRSNDVKPPSEQNHSAPNRSRPPLAATEKARSPTTAQIYPPDTDVDELASTMSALKFVPPSVRFGRGGRRGGFSRS